MVECLIFLSYSTSKFEYVRGDNIQAPPSWFREDGHVGWFDRMLDKFSWGIQILNLNLKGGSIRARPSQFREGGQVGWLKW